MLDYVNELSTAILTCTFSDENGNPIIPASGTYKIYASGEVVVTETSFIPDASSYEIIISADDNRIVDSSKTEEVHVVVVTWMKGSVKGAKEFRYKVKNLKYL